MNFFFQNCYKLTLCPAGIVLVIVVFDNRCSGYVLDQLEAERKFLLFAHHQDMLDAVEDAVRAKVHSFTPVSFCNNEEIL